MSGGDAANNIRARRGRQHDAARREGRQNPAEDEPLRFGVCSGWAEPCCSGAAEVPATARLGPRAGDGAQGGRGPAQPAATLPAAAPRRARPTRQARALPGQPSGSSEGASVRKAGGGWGADGGAGTVPGGLGEPDIRHRGGLAGAHAPRDARRRRQARPLRHHPGVCQAVHPAGGADGRARERAVLGDLRL